MLEDHRSAAMGWDSVYCWLHHARDLGAQRTQSGNLHSGSGLAARGSVRRPISSSLLS